MAITALPKAKYAPKAKQLPKMERSLGLTTARPRKAPTTVTYAAPRLPAGIPVKATPVTAPGTASPIPRTEIPENYIPSLDDIHADPLYTEALGSYNTSMQGLLRALRSNLSTAITRAGYDPSAAFQKLLAERPDLGEFSDLITAEAIAATGNNPLTGEPINPLSARAQAEQAYKSGMSNLDYDLAARGMGGSGAQVTGGNRILRERQMAEEGTRNALLDAINSGISGYLGQRASGAADLRNIEYQIGAMLAQRPGAVYAEGDLDLGDVAANQARETLVPGTNIPSAKSPPASYVPWGGQRMTSAKMMADWLRSHGASWDAWAQKHKDAARLLINLGNNR